MIRKAQTVSNPRGALHMTQLIALGHYAFTRDTGWQRGHLDGGHVYLAEVVLDQVLRTDG